MNRFNSAMMLNMTSLASMYGIGVLVIDEMQHLLNAKTNMDEVLNFLVTLSNTVGVPTVLIGTSKAQKIFSGNFRQARRASSSGSFIWDRLKKDSEEWNMFLEILWSFQCLKPFNILTEEIKDVFYEECQGITSVAVGLFIFSQLRALKNTKEIITTKILRDVAKEDFNLIKPMISALKKNIYSEIIKYDDITINYDEIIFKYDNNFEYLNMLKKLNEEKISLTSFKVQLKIDQIITDMELSGIFDNLKRDEITSIVTSIVENNSIDMDDRLLKQKAYKKAIALNDSKGNKNQQKNIIGNHEGLLCKRLI